MEAIDQQRTREAGYRNVAMFEVGFVGKVSVAAALYLNNYLPLYCAPF